MSHWDFGRRPDAGHDAAHDVAHDAPPPAEPADTAYQPDLMLGWGDAWAAQDGWAPSDGPTAENPPPAESTWPEGWPAGDAWDDDEDEGTAPYPITYERDDLAAAPPPVAPPPPPHAASAAPAGWQPRDRWHADFAGLPRPDGAGGDPGWPGAAPAPGVFDEDWPSRRAPRPARRGGRGWLVLAGVVVAGAAVGAAAVLLADGSPGGQASPSGAGQRSGGAAPPVPPAARASASAAPTPLTLTMTQAEAVLAGYTTANNNANAKRSDALLATVETGSSYAIDAGLYRQQQGTAPFPAFGPARATYYIPRGQQAAGPRWFVAQVANAFSANPGKVTSNEYLLFTQLAPGGPWLDAVEPYLTAGASAPRIAVGADGLATAVSLDTLALAVEPAQLPTATAASLDGTGSAPGQPPVPAPGNLADVNDQKFWQGKLPGGKVTDAHTAASGTAGQEFALQTADGGALVFYTDAAQVTLTPPAGTMLHLTVPGFYSPGQGLAQAGMSYLEQFAAYDPPADGGRAPSVVADYSGITGRN